MDRRGFEMGDVFVEKIVRRKMDLKMMGIRLLLILGVAVVVFIGMFTQLLCFLSAIVVVLAGWGAWWAWGFTNVEFEYALTNGDLDVDKILSQRTRKRLTTVKCREMELAAPVDAAHMGDFNDPNVKKTIDASSAPNAPGRWFIIYNAKDGVRTKLIFEPDERFIDGMHRAAPRKVLR